MDKIITLSHPLFFLQGQQPGGAGGLILSLLPMVVIFGIFYLLLIRPQQKRARQAQTEREQMLNALKPNDKVITTGGIYGTVVAVRDDRVQLRIAQSVSIEVERAHIAKPQAAEAKAEASK